MAWQWLQPWLVGRGDISIDPQMALTLVTLTARADAERDEIAFLADAEFEMLVEWARTGQFILALSAVDRSELTLLCVENASEMTRQVERLPTVAAGLAFFVVRTVMPLQLARISKPDLQ